MSVSLGANGGSYDYPQENDPAGWGDDATNWASAVSAALGNIGLGGTLNAKALLDLTSSTTKGFLPPKLTTTQRDAIATPPTGLVLYNTTKNQLEVYTGSTWASVSSVINDSLTVNGTTTLNGTLTVTGSTALQSVTSTGATINGSLTVTGSTSLQSVTSTGSTVNGALTVTGSTSLQSVTSTGATVNGVLSVTGNTTLVNVTGANVTSTGTILAASGSSGSPAYSFSGDPDTGMWNSAANQISFSVSGSEVGRVTSTYGGFKGNVIQVVQTTTNGTAVTTNTSTYQNYTALARSITPKYNNSKILIILSGSIFSTGAYNFYGGSIGIYSSLTSARVFSSDYPVDGRTNQLDQSNFPLSMVYLDSPATTSSITYTPQYISGYGYNFGFGWGTSSYHSLTLMEIQQ